MKWIKIVTDIFDDEKILLIESMPDADGIIVIWFKLLCLAGKQNNKGVFLMGRMPYTDEMFATVFRRPINTVRLALNTFERFGMIEIIGDTVTIPNWDKHQSLDAYEKKKERDRLYRAEKRAEQKQLADKSSDSRLTVARQSHDKSSDVAISDKSRLEGEKKEIRADLKKEKEILTYVSNTSSFFQKALANQGKGVVSMTDDEICDLIDKLGTQNFDRYVERLSSWIINKKAHVKSHYDTILKWVAEDSKVGN